MQPGVLGVRCGSSGWMARAATFARCRVKSKPYIAVQAESQHTSIIFLNLKKGDLVGGIAGFGQRLPVGLCILWALG